MICNSCHTHLHINKMLMQCFNKTVNVTARVLQGGRRHVQTAECRGWWAMAWQHGGEPGPGRGSFIGRGRRCRLVLLCSVGARNREGRGKEAGYGCLGDAHATPLAACHRPPALCQSSQRICAALSLSLYIPGLLVPLAETGALHTYIK